MNTINTMGIEQVLQQIRMNARSMDATAITGQASRADFSSILSQSIGAVNNLQADAVSLKTSYELGDQDIDLPAVMIATQKASLSFEAMTQVRNKLLNAYQEVMNMQV